MTLFERISNLAAFHWAPIVTSFYLLAFKAKYPGAQAGVVVLLAPVYTGILLLGVGFGDVLILSKWYWFLVAALHFTVLLFNYRQADNHHYLEGYWCIALAIAACLPVRDASESLACSGQGLIALCFIAACLNKLISRDFRSGNFMIYTLIFDPRMAAVSYLTGLSPKDVNEHQRARALILDGKTKRSAVPVPIRLIRLGKFLTWWTIFVEMSVAAIFVFPLPEADVFRFVTLLLFVVTTYILVPVPTFGMILMLIVSVGLEAASLRVLALAVMLLIPVITPFSQIIGTGLRIFYKRSGRMEM
jgi:hypothetical protein